MNSENLPAAVSRCPANFSAYSPGNSAAAQRQPRVTALTSANVAETDMSDETSLTPPNISRKDLEEPSDLGFYMVAGVGFEPT